MQPNGFESWQVLGGFTARHTNEARGSMKVMRKGTEWQKAELLEREEDFRISEVEGGFVKKTR